MSFSDYDPIAEFDLQDRMYRCDIHNIVYEEIGFGCPCCEDPELYDILKKEYKDDKNEN
jgi:hypothetical protein